MKSLSLSKPHLLIMTGIPGSGKSFFAEKFSETFHAPFISRNQLHKIIGDDEKTNDAVTYILTELMKTGQSLLIETDVDTRKNRHELARLARTKGYEPLFIWVQIDLSTAEQRATRAGKDKTNRMLSRQEHERLRKRFTPLSNEPSIVISGKHTYATQAKVVLTKLSTPRAAADVHAEPRRDDSRQDSVKPPRRNISIG